MGGDVSLQGQNNLSVTNSYIQVGDSDSQCDAGSAGAMRYNAATKMIEFCNATTWVSVNPVYDTSCDWACHTIYKN
ncbi:MAG: hypothetical protein FE834_05235 [Gammaproteobacteria bacterium]|uniref:Uncharacterized protein n=1 Tax=hydrothermal vent metagenome TaxID=652676 RepID=A0A1W1E4A2_9ZZZZ|nr:hypothetical protein [Gammaproteobacteria bacterium]